MNTNINPLIGASVRETVENVSEALEGLIELLPAGVPMEITPKMHARKTLIYSPANIAYTLNRVRGILESQVVDSLDYRVMKASLLDLSQKIGMTAPSGIASIDVEGDANDCIETAIGLLDHLVGCIANNHSGLCRLIDPMLHALEHAASEFHKESGRPRVYTEQALEEFAA